MYYKIYYKCNYNTITNIITNIYKLYYDIQKQIYPVLWTPPHLIISQLSQLFHLELELVHHFCSPRVVLIRRVEREEDTSLVTVRLKLHPFSSCEYITIFGLLNVVWNLEGLGGIFGEL